MEDKYKENFLAMTKAKNPSLNVTTLCSAVLSIQESGYISKEDIQQLYRGLEKLYSNT